MKILFASSEAHPLIKTGGLADVSGALPRALRNAGQDIRLVLPAYRQARRNAGPLREVARLTPPGTGGPVTLLYGRLPGSRVPLYLVDAPDCFDRDGGPYSAPEGHDWPDNAARFALFARAVCGLARDRAGLDWQPDLVHCNDWQTGLVPALLSLEENRPATLFTIHNLAYQGLFPHAEFQRLDLPMEWWSLHALEFHGQMSFIKGGLVFADRINTVSPTYAREIRTPGFGCGLDGLLRARASVLSGILNGVDYATWNPGTDRLIERRYTARNLDGKRDNKRALLHAFGLPDDDGALLFGHVGRLVDQKGIDLVLALIPQLVQRPLRLVILGTGDPGLEQALREAARRHPDRIGVHIGYSEARSHLLEAGSDAFLMPSRFEPCGLNQLYSLRYGTPPVVHRTGGLADSVVDATPERLADGSATGFVFDAPRPESLLAAMDRALALFADGAAWRRLMRQGMQADFSWKRSAAEYLELYHRTLETRR